MPELCEGIVATHMACAESSLDLVSGRPDLGDKIKDALRSQGTLSHNSFYRAGASHQSAALVLEIRAQNVPWSPRQPLLALNSTRGQACKGRLWTSTLTEPVQLESYSENWNGSLKGLVRLTHVAGQVRSAGAHTSMVPILEPKDLQDRGTIAALKRRRPGHVTATARLLSVWFGVKQHRGTAPPGLPSTLCRCSELVANVTPFRRNKSPKINQQIPSTAPSNFVRSVLPFVSTTRGSSECRPDDKAEATSRLVVLCDAKQGPQGFVADPKKPATIREHSCRVHVRQGLPSCESEPCSAKKKAGRFRVLTYLTKGRAAGPRELHKGGAPRRPLRQVGRVVGHPPRVRGWVGLLVAMKHGGRVMPTINFLLD